MERIPVAGPWITEKEIAYVTDAVANAWYEEANVYQQRFERAFADYLGVRFAICLPSCTSAIHLSLAALGIGPGDEVVVPDITWIASAAPISYVGAQPVFADVDPKTWCLCPDSFRACITPRTRAVIPVDLYGNISAMDAIRETTERCRIAIIEDAAQALGGEYQGRKAGSFGDTGVFSFHGTKTVTTGEGGMLATNQEDIYRRVLFLRDHGRQPGEKMFWNTEVAYKYRMSSLQAALGLAQLERIEELIARKRQIFSWYEEELASVPDLTMNFEAKGTRNTFWMVTVILAESLGLEKEPGMRLMRERKIDCRPFFYPLSSLPAYERLGQAQQARERNRVSYGISPYGMNLPSALTLTREQVRYVCDVLKDILQRK